MAPTVLISTESISKDCDEIGIWIGVAATIAGFVFIPVIVFLCGCGKRNDDEKLAGAADVVPMQKEKEDESSKQGPRPILSTLNTSQPGPASMSKTSSSLSGTTAGISPSLQVVTSFRLKKRSGGRGSGSQRSQKPQSQRSAGGMQKSGRVQQSSSQKGASQKQGSRSQRTSSRSKNSK